MKITILTLFKELFDGFIISQFPRFVNRPGAHYVAMILQQHIHDEKESPAKIARCKEMLALLLEKVDTLIF